MQYLVRSPVTLDFTVQRPRRRSSLVPGPDLRFWSQALEPDQSQDLAPGHGPRTWSQDLASGVGRKADLQDLLQASIPVSFGTSKFPDVL